MELLLPPRSAFQQSGLSIASSHSFLTSDNVSARSNGGSSTPLMQISALFEHLKRSVLEQAPQRSTEHSNPGQVIPAQAKEVTQISRRRPSKRMRVANKIFDATSPSKKNLSDAHVKGTVRFSTKLSNPNHDHMELEPLDYGGEKELNNAHSDDVVNTSLNAFSSPKQAVPIALISDSEEKDKQFMDSFITPQPLRRNHEMTSSPDPMEMEPLDHGTEHELSDMPSDVAVSTNFNDYTAPLNDEIDHTAEPSQPIFETNPANSLESIKTNKRIARPKRKRKAPLNRRRATVCFCLHCFVCRCFYADNSSLFNFHLVLSFALLKTMLHLFLKYVAESACAYRLCSFGRVNELIMLARSALDLTRL